MTKSSRPVVRKAYHRQSSPIGFKKPSRTRQADAQSCDVNHILSRYAKDGVLTHVQKSPGTYLDIASIGAADYHDALNKVILAGDAFDALPSSVREFYRNDPAAFLNAVETGSLDPSLYDVLGIPSPLAEQSAGGGEAAGGTSGPTPKGSSESLTSEKD